MAKLAEKTFSRETFSHKPNVKTGRVVPSNLRPEKDILKLLRRIYIKMPWQSKQEALRLVNCMTAIWIITSYDPPTQEAMHKSLQMTRRNQALKSGEPKASSSPSQPPHSKQPTSVQLLLLAASSNQRPQTPWCHLQSVFLSFRTSSQQATNLCPVAAARS